MNAVELKNAMLSNGGVRDVRVALVDASIARKHADLKVKWDGILTLNNFPYLDNTFTVRRAYIVGEGKQVKVPDYSQPAEFKCEFSPGNFMELSSSDGSSKRRNAEDTDKGLSSTGQQDHDTNALFSCPNNGCTRLYQRYSGF